MDTEQKREILLAGIRCARLRTALLTAEIDEIGVALKSNLLTPEVAVGWLCDIGAIQYINPDIASAEAA